MTLYAINDISSNEVIPDNPFPSNLVRNINDNGWTNQIRKIELIDGHPVFEEMAWCVDMCSAMRSERDTCHAIPIFLDRCDFAARNGRIARVYLRVFVQLMWKIVDAHPGDWMKQILYAMQLWICVINASRAPSALTSAVNVAANEENVRSSRSTGAAEVRIY